MQLRVFTIEGDESRAIEVGDVYAYEDRPDLAHRVVRWQLAKRRSGNAHTKDRSQIAGSTKKLYRQKGTGRARKGNIKSPLLRGGGTVFGPKKRSFAHSLPKKLRKRALSSVLSSKIRRDSFVIIEPFEMDEPRTKSVKTILANLDIETNKVLFLIGNNEEVYTNLRFSANNIPGIKTLRSIGANVYDVLNADMVVATVAAVEEIEERLQLVKNVQTVEEGVSE